MAMTPSVDSTRLPDALLPIVREKPNPGGCRKHCHYPTIQTRRYSAAGDIVRGCPCMENRVECDFEWDRTGRGFCKNCHHGSSLTVKESDCKLDF